MRLRQTQKHWDQFARTDPLWAVLSAPDKKGNQWQPDEFFATGVTVVEGELAHVRAHCPALRTRAALDFGCGVGRLSQALAAHFERVVGVDLSAEMLALARRHNRHGDRVSYVRNTADDLRVLRDGQFDFVYSLITLQPMAPVYARRYIAEFVRVAPPGGVILFQLPAQPRRARPFTLRPDTLLKRAYRDVRRKFSVEPLMEMHALPREEVEAILVGAGAQVVRSYRYDAAGDEMASWGYLALRPRTAGETP